jgi:hypothetical protein
LNRFVGTGLHYGVVLWRVDREVLRFHGVQCLAGEVAAVATVGLSQKNGDTVAKPPSSGNVDPKVYRSFDRVIAGRLTIQSPPDVMLCSARRSG